MTHRRRDICLTWAGANLTGNAASRAIRRLGMRLRILALCGVRPAMRLNDGAGDLSARVVFSRYGYEAGLRLIDTLLQVGSEGEREDGPGDDGDPFARAVVESALRKPVPLPQGGPRQSANGRNGHVNGNGHVDGNGHGNGTRSSEKSPARVPSGA